MKRGSLLGFGTDNQVAFFHSQHILGFQSEIADTELLTGLRQQIPEGLHIRCGHMQLVGQFPHKSQTHAPNGDGVLDHKLPVPGIGEGFIGNIRIRDFLKYLTGVGTCEINDPERIGKVDHVKTPAVITGMIPQPFHGGAGPGGRGAKIIIIFSSFDHHTIINDTAVFVAHGRIFDLSL